MSGMPTNYLWRLAATAVAITLVPAGGFLLAITVLPLLRLLPGWQRSRAQWVLRWAFRLFLGVLATLRLISFRLDDLERLRAPGGRLIIANHPCLLDVVVLMSVLPRAQCIVKHELWSHPLLGSVMRGAGFIRNDLEPDQLLEACRKSLAADEQLIIFPEGTRTRPGEKPQFRRGFANLATLTGAKIQLVLLTCTPLTLTKGEPWWRIPAQRPLFHLSTDRCIEAGEYLVHEHRSLSARELVRSLEVYYAEKLGYV